MSYAISCPITPPTTSKAKNMVDVKIDGFRTENWISYDVGYVVFTITNHTRRPITNVLIQFTYFDRDGRAVGVDHYLVVFPSERETIGPHESYTGEYKTSNDAMRLAKTAKGKVESFDYA
jgi:hypothetical protein